MNYTDELNKLLEVFSKNYAIWSTRANITNLAPPHFIVEPGNTYDKILKVDDNGSSSSAVGFIVKKANKKFVIGDILKANSYRAPATNFARGNLFDGYNESRIQWTGVS